MFFEYEVLMLTLLFLIDNLFWILVQPMLLAEMFHSGQIYGWNSIDY